MWVKADYLKHVGGPATWKNTELGGNIADKRTNLPRGESGRGQELL